MHKFYAITMKTTFARIITLLRKEKNISQKQAAQDLHISQALLSHYEKGVRECGLSFVIKCSEYYQVSCDYLLGRTPDRMGTMLTLSDLPDESACGKENTIKHGLLAVLNKKLIFNSLHILFDMLNKRNSTTLTSEVSTYLSAAVYRGFYTLYTANPKNPREIFSIPDELRDGFTNALQSVCEAKINCTIQHDLKCPESLYPSLSPKKISETYPKFSASLYNLIKNVEAKTPSQNAQ